MSWAPVKWLFLAALWLGLVGNWVLSEALAGALAALIALFAARLVRSRIRAEWRPKARWLAEVWRVPGYVVTGTWEVGIALWRQLFTRRGAQSQVFAVPFHAGGHHPSTFARRALAIVFNTIAPNSIVIGIVEEQDLLLYHQVLPGPLRPTTKLLGAKPEGARP